MTFELTLPSGRWVLTKLLVCVLVLFVCGCATTSQSTRDSQAHVKQRGPEIIIKSDERIHYFENRLPHCLAFSLTGEWEFAIQEAALRTPDRRRFVGVRLVATETMPGAPRADPVSRAVAYFQADTKKDWGQPVPSIVELFSAARSGAVLLQFDEVTITPESAARALGSEKPKVGEIVRIQNRVIAPFLPGLVLVVTVFDVTDARQVLDTLEIMNHPSGVGSFDSGAFPGVLR